MSACLKSNHLNSCYSAVINIRIQPFKVEFLVVKGSVFCIIKQVVYAVVGDLRNSRLLTSSILLWLHPC